MGTRGVTRISPRRTRAPTSSGVIVTTGMSGANLGSSGWPERYWCMVPETLWPAATASITKDVPVAASPAANTPGREAAYVSGSMSMVFWRVTPTPASSGMKARPACWPMEKMTVSQSMTCSEPGSVSSLSLPVCVELHEGHVDALDAGDAPRLVADARERTRGIELDALLLCLLDLPGMCRHLLARLQAGHGHRLGPQAHGRAGAVDGDVAAAQDEDPLAGHLLADGVFALSPARPGGHRAGTACSAGRRAGPRPGWAASCPCVRRPR